MALMGWATHVLQGLLQRPHKPAKVRCSKGSLSSDGRLQLAFLKLESLVIVDQHATVNLFLRSTLIAHQGLKAGLALSSLTLPPVAIAGEWR